MFLMLPSSRYKSSLFSGHQHSRSLQNKSLQQYTGPAGVRKTCYTPWVLTSCFPHLQLHVLAPCYTGPATHQLSVSRRILIESTSYSFLQVSIASWLKSRAFAVRKAREESFIQAAVFFLLLVKIHPTGFFCSFQQKHPNSYFTNSKMNIFFLTAQKSGCTVKSMACHSLRQCF